MKILWVIGLLFIYICTLPLVQANESCSDALPGRLVIDGRGRVTPGFSNNLRVEPSRSAERVGQLSAGTEFTVTGGPICSDGMRWWHVSAFETFGWTVEGAEGEYWLEPLKAFLSECVSNLTIGEKAQAIGLVGSILSEPSFLSKDLGEIPQWALFDVLSGPVCDESALWVEVHYEGIIGWFAEIRVFGCEMYCSGEELYAYARVPLKSLEDVVISPDEDIFRVQQPPSLATDAISLENVDQITTLKVLGDGVPRGFAWSADGVHLAISGSDHVRVYNVNKLNSPAYEIKGFDGLVNTGRYSPNGRLFVASDRSGKVYIWDTAGYERIGLLEHADAVSQTVFSDNGEMLAVRGEGEITLWSLRDPMEPSILHTFPEYSGQLAFVLGDSRLLSVNSQGINTFDVESGELTWLTEDFYLNSFSRSIADWAIAPNDQYISTVIEELIGDTRLAGNYMVVSWDLETGEVGSPVDRDVVPIGTNFEPLGSIMMAYESSNDGLLVNIAGRQWFMGYYFCDCTSQFNWPDVRTIAYHPNAPILATGHLNGEIRLYRRNEFYGVLYGFNASVNKLEFSPNGDYLAATGSDNSVRVWRIEDQRRLGSVVYQNFDSSFMLGPDEQTLFGSQHTWDLSTGQASPLPLHPEGDLVQVRPDGNFVISNAQTATYGIYNPLSDQFISEFSVQSDSFYQHVISHDGRRLAYIFVDRYNNKSVRVVDLDDGREIRRWENLFESPYQMLLSPDGCFLLVYETGGLDVRPKSFVLLDVETGDVRSNILLMEEASSILDGGMAYSPDGTRVAWVIYYRIDEIVKIALHAFDLPSQQLLFVKEIPSFNRRLSFSGDGSLLAFSSENEIYLVDSTTGEEVRRLDGHLGSVSSMMFSEDGRYLYSTGSDYQLRIWGVGP